MAIKHRTLVKSLLGIACAAALSAHAAPEAGSLKLKQGDHIAIIGNTLADRMQHDGWLETLVYAKFPKEQLVFRNLSKAGDEVATWHRSENFGTRDEWLTKAGADVVFAYYGYNESFKGDAGLAEFKSDLDKFLKETGAKNYNGKGSPRVVLFSPIAAERNKDSNLPEPGPVNENLKKYVAAMAEVAKANGVEFVDLFSPSQRLFDEAARQGKSLTMDGRHLTEEGDRMLAPEMFREIFGESAPEGDFQKLRAAIVDRNERWHDRYRTVDGFNVYGGRSALAYQPDQGKFLQNIRNPPPPYISNYQVMQEEMAQRDVMTANRDKVIWAAAEGKTVQANDTNLPPVQTVPTNHPGDRPDKSWTFLSGQDAIAKMKAPEHVKINLFADEQMYPELIKPVQMAWDQKGRLWVSVWRNYPERTPTSTIGDSIIILEDRDGDGKADKITHFMDNLNCPTGFQFYKGGLLLMQAPDLWYVPTGPDGKGDASKIERVVMGLDSADSHHTTNSMVLDPGGATYLSDGVFHRTQLETANGPLRNTDGAVYRYEPRTGNVDTYVAYGFANPHGRVFDYWGNDIITDATGNASYFAPAFSGRIDYPAKHPKMEQFWARPSRPCPGTGLMTSNHFPQEYWGNFLNINVISFQGIYRVKMTEQGSGLAGTSLEDLVSSSDPNFRPAQVNVGPDGAVYFADWSNDIIGHMQHHLRDPNRDHIHGRIYRMTYEGRPLDKPHKIDGEPVAALLELLKDPEDQVRLWAKIELDKHDAAEVIPAVNGWAAALDKNSPAYEHHMMEALWMHQWFNVVDVDLLKRMLRSPEPHARAAATRVLCYWRDRVPQTLALLKVQAGDEHPRVRLEAVRAASFFRDGAAADAALAALKFPTDYYLDYCLKETMKQLQPYWRKAITEGKPIAADNPAGLAFLVGGVDTSELLKMQRTAAVSDVILSRPGIPDATRNEVLVALAAERKMSPAAVLLEKIGAAKADGKGAAVLAKMLPAQPQADLEKVKDQLAGLAKAGAPEIRQPAIAAVVAAEGTFDSQWKQAAKNPEKVIDVLSAVPLVFDQDLRETMLDRVNGFLGAELPADVVGNVASQSGAKGRFVRIELPRPGALSLAEVQVFSGGKNIAVGGKAIQSSTANGAEASRAIDGKTDGAFNNGSVTHTNEKDKKPYWELNLGSEQAIDSIAVWNRTDGDGKYASRLEGFRLIVLDGKHKEVWKKEGNPAPAQSARFALAPDEAGAIRRAAIRAAVSIQKDQEKTFAALVSLIERGTEVPTDSRGIRALPQKKWPKDQAGKAARALVAWAKQIPAGERTSEDYVQTVQLAGDLCGLLPENEATPMRKVVKELGVSVFSVGTVREQMRYDTPRLVVEAGKPFEIIFENSDFMPHNLVVIVPGSRPKVGAASANMKPDELDAQGRPYMPKMAEILGGTKLVEAGMKTTINLSAPAKEGDYEYVCTFPGHWEAMWGKLVVTKDVDAYLQAHPDAGPGPGPAASAHVHH